MGIFDKLFGGKKGKSSKKRKQIKYMELPRPDGDHGLCSDDECPCDPLGVPIPCGEGYIYISHHVVDFRKDCLTVREAHNKVQRLVNGMGGGAYTASSGVFAPILVCEKGAKKRGLNLEIAAADAHHWWKTGLVPLRPTPKARKQRPM